MNPSDKISNHFTWKEATWLPTWQRCANDQELTQEIQDTLTALFAKMDSVRDFFQAAIHVHVAFRPEAYNTLIGGAPDSEHAKGGACDFDVAGIDCDTARQRILDAGLLESLGMRMENKPGSNWVHLDIGIPRPNRYFIP